MYEQQGNPNFSSLRSAVELYLQDSASMSKSTHEQRTRILKRFFKWMEANFPKVHRGRQLGRCHLSRWRAALMRNNLSIPSKRTECVILQGFLNWCAEEEIVWRPLKAIPACSRKQFLTARPRPIAMRTEKTREIISSMPEGLHRDCIYLLAATGMRRNELLGLRGACWDEDGLTILPGRETTKTHARTLPLSGRAAEICRKRSDQFVMFTNNGKPLVRQLNHWLEGYCTPHDFRRWLYSTLESMECPGYVIKDIMGHRSGVRDHYAQMSKMKTWLEKIDLILQYGISSSVNSGSAATSASCSSSGVALGR